MDKLCKFFGVEYDDLYKVLIDTNSFIAGGAALRTMLMDEDKEPFIDQDLDIFIRLNYSKTEYMKMQEDGDFTKYQCDKINKIYQEFFKKYQYKCKYSHNQYRMMVLKTKSSDVLDYSDDEILSMYIKNIHVYKNDNGRQAQLIYIFNHKIEEFLNTFDLNICKIAIVPYLNELQFYHNITNYISDDDLAMIKRKEMYITQISNTGRMANRIMKYIDRGFYWRDINKTDEITDEMRAEQAKIEYEVIYDYCI